MKVLYASKLRRRIPTSILTLALALLTCVGLMWAIGVGAEPPRASTFDVCPVGCAYAEVQPAIDAAAPGDVIRVAQGRYVGTLEVDKSIFLQGGYSGIPDWHREPSVYETILDGNRTDAVIRITDHVSPTVDGFTITGGRSGGRGGGIEILYGSPIVSHNTIYDNAAEYGGGVGLWAVSALLRHNTVVSNSARIHGGGIAVFGGTARMGSNTIVSNTAGMYGGGLYTIGRRTTPSIDGNRIIGNLAGHGGGVFVDDYSLPTLTNNVIARNHGRSNGGGIYIDYYAQPQIINNSIVANNLGPHWANEGIFTFGVVTPTIVNNNIVTHHYAIRGGGGARLIDYNNLWDCTADCYAGGTPGPHDISEDPLFVHPQEDDYHVRCGSPVIDAGTREGAPDLDFDGDARPTRRGIDIGADEYAGDWPPFEPGVDDRVCVSTNDCGWLHGVNYPWLHYGHDFGQAAWPTGQWSHDGVSQISSTHQVEMDLAYLRDVGSSSIRWFVLADGRASPEFDEQGYVSGLDEHVYADLDAALALSCKHNQRSILVLLDYLWLDAPTFEGGVQLGGHADVIVDPAKRQSFFDNALGPILERYGHDPRIAAWEVINEPEWRMEGVPDNETSESMVSVQEMQAFVDQAVRFIHAHADQPVTLGSAQARWLPYWRDVGLDFYQFHHYEDARTQPPFRHYSDLCLDKPAILGEYPTADTEIGMTEYLSTAWENGYAGALAWSLGAGDRSSNFWAEEDAFDQWSQAHPTEVHLPWLCGAYIPVVLHE